MALMVAQEVPASSTMAVPHGPAGVGAARHRMRAELRACGAPDDIVDDATLILSELLSNACRHARPLSPHGEATAGGTVDAGGTVGAGGAGPAAGAHEEFVRAAWSRGAKGELTISVTDGGGPTRPLAATPSVTARGGRGLAIITSLASDWGVEECTGTGGPVGAAGGPHTGVRVRDTRFRGRGGGTVVPGPPGAAPGVTVWAVLAPGDGFGAAFAGLGLAELAELEEMAELDELAELDESA
ncbi:ATP-binding protein [Streptomyces sp. N2-109]|uniref:ATP-binding protein n=1 Tax=Streptomyces gossypii TaxID=2883101 RepID=A0ABT2JN97_9ACTN|nr:ATP-binding protein [Streptomyces gossypii]MCT2589352.1 ATP-binding protein [Streptomyces gossypii]